MYITILTKLVSLSDAQIPKGISHQQYAVSSANKLGDFLSDILNNMQMSYLVWVLNPNLVAGGNAAAEAVQ
jgi:hypothetical protein